MNAFTQFAMEVRACGGQMMSNAAYIQKELPGIDMPDELRSQIEKLCTDLVGSRFDLNTEANEFEGAIAANANLDALTRKAEMVRGWIAGDIGSIQACVEAVTNAVEAGTASPILSMLIMESAVNIFNATPTWPATEEVAEEQEEPGDEDHDIGNDCYGFYCEDSYPVGQLADAIGQLMERPELCAETIEQLRTFRFAMDRLPLVTAGIQMTVRLRYDFGGESDWMEIQMEPDVFTLGRGRWIDGDAHTETVFEVGFGYREGDAFQASNFALSFISCAEDVCREVVIDDSSDESFDGWSLAKDESRWSDLPCSFL